MTINYFITLVATVFLLSTPVIADSDVNHKDLLNEAIASANANKASPEVAGNHLHDAYEVAFQMGQFSMAKKLLATATSQGIELSIWDQVALSEIFAREGNYIRSKERIDFAIENLLKSKCSYNPIWGEFQAALSSKNTAQINAILGDGDKPALINTYLDEEASHKIPQVYFHSLSGGYPDAVPVTLIVNEKGRIKCISVESDAPKVKKMLTALNSRRFKPASVNGENVWQYGKTYVVKFKHGNPVIRDYMRPDKDEALPTINVDISRAEKYRRSNSGNNN